MNKTGTEKAIGEIDAGRLTGVEFHHEIFTFGVVTVQVYLAYRKIYYIGVDAQYYLEEY